MQPLNENVLVKPEKEETTSKGGIVLQSTTEEKNTNIGEVLEADEDLHYPELVGSRVVFGKYAGVTVNVDGENLLLIKYKELLGVL